MNDTQTSKSGIPAQQESEGQAQILLNLESLIKSHVKRIDTLKAEVKERQNMLTDSFSHDTTYKMHEDKVKEVNKLKQQAKNAILQQPAVATLSQKLKSLKTEKKELETALSDYLREYHRLSGSNEIEGENGDVREIVYVVKLVKRSSRTTK